ncbi:MAG: ECF-type sigma factor [Acidobacteriota bacterium]
MTTKTKSGSFSAPRLTELLDDWVQQREGAEERLLSAVLPELRAMARRHIRRERPNHTLQPTDIVHETYLKLLSTQLDGFESRRHFFAFASRLIREVLVEHARARGREKRGGAVEHEALDTIVETVPGHAMDLDKILVVDDGLRRLREVDPRQARIAEMRFFAGLTMPEIADVMDLSVATVERAWSIARRRLGRLLTVSTQPVSTSSNSA